MIRHVPSGIAEEPRVTELGLQLSGEHAIVNDSEIVPQPAAATAHQPAADNRPGSRREFMRDGNITPASLPPGGLVVGLRGRARRETEDRPTSKATPVPRRGGSMQLLAAPCRRAPPVPTSVQREVSRGSELASRQDAKDAGSGGQSSMFLSLGVPGPWRSLSVRVLFSSL
jgi:hypothetical protein